MLTVGTADLPAHNKPSVTFDLFETWLWDNFSWGWSRNQLIVNPLKETEAVAWAFLVRRCWYGEWWNAFSALVRIQLSLPVPGLRAWNLFLVEKLFIKNLRGLQSFQEWFSKATLMLFPMRKSRSNSTKPVWLAKFPPEIRIGNLKKSCGTLNRFILPGDIWCQNDELKFKKISAASLTHRID